MKSLFIRAHMIEDDNERDLVIMDGVRLAGEDGWPHVITAGRFLAPPGGYSQVGARSDRRRAGLTKPVPEPLSPCGTPARLPVIGGRY